MSALAPSPTIGIDPELSAFFLGRLGALVRQQIAAPTAHKRVALAQAAFAIYLDCLDLGLADEAGAILACLRVEVAPVGHLVA
jgi:hypothetical protein